MNLNKLGLETLLNNNLLHLKSVRTIRTLLK